MKTPNNTITALTTSATTAQALFNPMKKDETKFDTSVTSVVAIAITAWLEARELVQPTKVERASDNSNIDEYITFMEADRVYTATLAEYNSAISSALNFAGSEGNKGALTGTASKLYDGVTKFMTKTPTQFAELVSSPAFQGFSFESMTAYNQVWKLLQTVLDGTKIHSILKETPENYWGVENIIVNPKGKWELLLGDSAHDARIAKLITKHNEGNSATTNINAELKRRLTKSTKSTKASLGLKVTDRLPSEVMTDVLVHDTLLSGILVIRNQINELNKVKDIEKLDTLKAQLKVYEDMKSILEN